MARNENGKGFSLKDHLFNRQKVLFLGQSFEKADHQFDAQVFTKKVMTTLPKLELKERIVWIASVLEEQLPDDFDAAAQILIKALPEPLSPDRSDNDFGDFIFAPMGEYVVRNGLSEKYLHTSLSVLEEITQRFSMEDAIRYFLNEFEEDTLKELWTWVTHRNYHVRRLVSEGTRPLLPWSGRIRMDITKAIPYLDELYYDPTRYVTRSVANHMNDIAKKEPDLAIKTLQRWKSEGKQNPKEMDWIISHSLRTLVKQGNAEALRLLGYHSKPNVQVSNFSVTPKSIRIGGAVEFTFTVTTQGAGKLMIDYAINFQKANGKRAERVFKLKKLNVKADEVHVVTKKHLFPEAATTLTFYPGEHTVTLQINGQRFSAENFQLKS